MTHNPGLKPAENNPNQFKVNAGNENKSKLHMCLKKEGKLLNSKERNGKNMKVNLLYKGCYEWGPSIHKTQRKISYLKSKQHSLLLTHMQKLQ